MPYVYTGLLIPVASQVINADILVTVAGYSLLIGEGVGAIFLPIIPLVIAFLLLPVTIFISMFVKFKNVDRAKEYMCGEKIEYKFSSFYFSTEKATPYFAAIGILFFVALIIVAL